MTTADLTIPMPGAPARVLVVGETGAGKTDLIESIRRSDAVKNVTFLDAPPTRALLVELVTGAPPIDLALWVIAADQPASESPARFPEALRMLGVRRAIIVLTKLDLADAALPDLEARSRAALEAAGVVCSKVFTNNDETIPASLVLRREPAPLRFAVHEVRRVDGRRLVAGHVESGAMRVGETLLFSPFNKTATITGLMSWPDGATVDTIQSGASAAITLGEQIFIETGHVASLQEDAPIVAKRLKATIFWEGNRDLTLGATCTMKIVTESVECEIVTIENVLDAATLQAPPIRSGFSRISRSDLAEVTLQTRGPLALDNHDRVPAMGRFVLMEEGQAIGGGIIHGGVYTDRHAVKSQNITWSEGAITTADRSRRNRHRGAVVWLTGLSGAGKSTLAHELERELFERQFHVYVLDGDNVRHGLNANLGFSPEDRLENIRRVGEVARLMADSGMVTLTAFISPYRADRRRAREIALEGGCEFIEIFVDASLAECERRDPKNLYKKARAGQIKQFTGIDAPYERPEDPEIVVNTDRQTAAESVAVIMESLLQRLRMES